MPGYFLTMLAQYFTAILQSRQSTGQNLNQIHISNESHVFNGSEGNNTVEPDLTTFNFSSRASSWGQINPTGVINYMEYRYTNLLQGIS
jgi:hypothetical protein